MLIRAVTLVMVGLTMVSPAKADESIGAFARADGFLPIDPGYFWTEDWNGLHRFPYPEQGSILQADYPLSDAEKAILAIEALEQPLPHVRYRITSREVPAKEDWHSPYRFVEITRFNLGPTLLASVAEAYDGVFTPVAPVADPAPHVTWRWVFFSDKYMAASPAAVARRIMPASEAAEAQCFGLPCLALTDPLGEGWDWGGINVDETTYSAPYPDTASNGLTVPARIASLLQFAGDLRSPYEMVISSGVVAQDDSANGILRYNPFLADEVSSDWLVRRQIAGNAPHWGRIRSPGQPGEQMWVLPDGFDPGPLERLHIPTEGIPSWRMNITFESGVDQPVTYQTFSNKGVATFQSDHWLYIGLPDVPGVLLARNPTGGISLPILPYDQYAHEYIGWNDVPAQIIPTGQSMHIGDFTAQEYALVYNQPAISTEEYLVWTGHIWAVAELPAVIGWYGLPGSPFAGRSGLFRLTWHDLVRDLAPVGLILRAEITRHDRMRQDDLMAVINAEKDASSLLQIGRSHPRMTMQMSDLSVEDTGMLSRIFPDLAPIGTMRWPFDLPAQSTAVLR